MSVQIEMGETALILNISGGTAVTTLRRKIEIPYNSFEEVQVGNFEFPLTAIKRTGITTLGIKLGFSLLIKRNIFYPIMTLIK